jgi:GNAT superfamily N-acetyltransferase
VPPIRNPRPSTRRQRLARRRRQAALQLGRVFEIVETDMMMWEADRPLRAPRARAEVEVRRIRAADEVEWQRLLPPERWTRARVFFTRDDVGFVALVEGRFAGWVWLSRVSHRDPYSGLRIRLAPDEGYAYALWIEPESRPHGLGPHLMTAMLTEARDVHALARVYGWVDRRNRESQMLLRMLGFVSAQRARRVHVLHRVGRALPGSVEPRYGPLSRAGRHSEAA